MYPTPFWLKTSVRLPLALNKQVEVCLLNPENALELAQVDEIFIQQINFCASYSEIAEMIDMSRTHVSRCLIVKDRIQQHILGAALFSVPRLGVNATCTLFSLAVSPVCYGKNRGIGSILLLSVVNYIEQNTIMDTLELESSLAGRNLYDSFHMTNVKDDDYQLKLPLPMSTKQDIHRKVKKYGRHFLGKLHYLHVRYAQFEVETGLHLLETKWGIAVVKDLPPKYYGRKDSFILPLYILADLHHKPEHDYFFAKYFSPNDIAAFKIQNAYRRYKSKSVICATYHG